MRIWCAALLLATGCGRILGIGDFHLADATGSGSDGTSGDGALCVGNGFLGTVCLTADPPASVAISAAIDTDATGACTQLLAQGTAADVCIVAGHTIAVQGSVAVTGSRPLALVALDSLTIDGTLDASSGSANGNVKRVGAGADPASCPALTGLAGGNNGGSGGAGGGMGTPGGAGGGNSSGTPGAAPDSPFTPTKLRGGCPGGTGGTGGTTNNGGPGGAGGGGIYLLAGTSIVVTGAVYASGAGGAGGGQNRGGGGGGGAGGFIGLEAPTVTVGGTITANGGGGGGGGDGGAGSPGEDGTTSAYSTAALGGAGYQTKASGGGNGGALSAAAQDGITNPVCCGAAGGGGGGVGIVWVKGTFSGQKVSPAPMQH